jgi:two-component system aerobic respiration control sensor histidine kinase ArcB
MNLLSNAFKFTSKGCIIVRLERIDKLIKIEVQDSGLGIKLEDQPKLMTAFGKLNNGESGKLNE